MPKARNDDELQQKFTLEGSSRDPAPDKPLTGDGAEPPAPPSSNGYESLAATPDGPLRRLMDDNFLQYASYVIRDRAIPQLEDGLKPVQRRIMHALWEKDDGKFHKVANISGHAMQYHPHGDASITDALVNLVNKRYLIEGQGNFGNIHTGDPAAASRYIECRLTPLAREELFNPALTEFVPSYDGRNKEPVTLPSKLPLLLMLGADGIAVGLSTRILPHNFIELLKAQIAILEDRKFKVLPDFISGGLMDASEYDKGNGKVKVRAIIEKQGDNKLVIRQLPFGTTTDSVISSIEDAVRKKKIRIRSIHDFTAENVEIQITLSPGEKVEKAVAGLYHYTQCEVSLSSNIVVISGNRPMQLTVDDVLRDNTQQLLDLLCQELELRKKKLENELHFKSLAQIFIENRIYKRIEQAGTYEKVQKEVLNGLAPFRPQLTRDVTLEDVEMLLELRIKRISKFDIEKNRDEMAKIAAELKEIEKHLEELVAYAIAYLQRLIDKYKSEYKRRTKLKEAEEIDVRKLTANELAIVHDHEKGFLGYEVKGEPSFRCSPLDRLVVVWNDGRYQVMPPPEKLFVDKNILYFGIFHREKEFTVIYQTAKAAFLKRFTFGGAIMNRDYNLAQDNSKIIFFSERTAKQLRLKFRKTKGARVTEETVNLSDVPIRSAKSKGNQVAKRTISSVSIVN